VKAQKSSFKSPYHSFSSIIIESVWYIFSVWCINKHGRICVRDPANVCIISTSNACLFQ